MKFVRLGDVVQVTGGGTPRRSTAAYYGGDVPWVTPKDMKKWIISDSAIRLTQDGLNSSPAKLINAGSILVVVRSGVLKHTLPVALSGAVVTVNQDMKALTPADRVHGPFLARYIKSVQPTILGWVRATTADNFPIDSLLDLQVPLPSLDEQQRIAATLDQADAILAKRRESLDRVARFTRAHLRELLSEPGGWPTASLAELSESIVDCPHSTPSWIADGAVCLRTSNLTAGGWDWSDTRYVSEAEYTERSRRGEAMPGDIILSREGTVGVAAIVEPGMRICMGQRLVQVRVDRNVLVPEYALSYLLHVLEPSRIGHAMVGSTAQHLNVSALKALQLPVPALATQESFARRMREVSMFRRRAAAHLTSLGGLFAATQQTVFAGAQ